MADLCEKCGENLTGVDAFCGGCGEPVPGKKAARPRVGEIARKHRKKAHRGKINTGRKAILAVAILQVIFGVFIMIMLSNLGAASDVLILNGVMLFGVAGVFFGLWIWAKSAPYPASVTALVVFVTLHAAAAAQNPAALLQGLLIKIIVLVCLINAIKSAAAYRKMQLQEAEA